ncbi:hypothetical protein QP150_04160 [Sphingomonas sp. 22L2VL55-3]
MSPNGAIAPGRTEALAVTVLPIEIVVIIEPLPTQARIAERRRIDLGIAEPVVRVQRHRAGVAGEAGAGIDRIDLADVADIADENARRRAADIGARPGGDTGSLQREVRRDARIDAREARMDIVVAETIAPAESMLVPIADLARDTLGLDRRVDASGEAGIGQHVATVEIGGQRLVCLDIRIDRDAARRLRGLRRQIGLRDDRRGGQCGEHATAGDQRQLHPPSVQCPHHDACP